MGSNCDVACRCLQILLLLLSYVKHVWAVEVGGLFSVEPSPVYPEAFVTLLHDEGYMSGVRTLRASLRSEKSDIDMVCMVTAKISSEAHATLREDGWKLAMIPYIKKPELVEGMDSRHHLRGVFSKLAVFNLPYKKILYLDADTVVVGNVSEIFHNSPSSVFAARFGFKNSNHFNSGVMLLTPSHARFRNMLRKMNEIHAGDGLDQGFLNAYFSGLGTASLCAAENVSSMPLKFHNQLPDDVHMCQLPSSYNSETGLSLLHASRWDVPPDTRIIHFALGPFKPWDWWTYWLVNPARRWYGLYLLVRGPVKLVDLGVSFVIIGASILVQMYYIRVNLNFQRKMQSSPCLLLKVGTTPYVLMGGFVAVPVSLYLSGAVIPRRLDPLWAWSIFASLVPAVQLLCFHLAYQLINLDILERVRKVIRASGSSWKPLRVAKRAVSGHILHFTILSVVYFLLPFVLKQPVPFTLRCALIALFLLNVILSSIGMWVLGFCCYLPQSRNDRLKVHQCPY